MSKTLNMKAAFIALIGSISFAAQGMAGTQKIDVPAGDLITALQSLEKQAAVDLVYQDAQVKGLRTAGVKGEFSPQEALAKLLEGTSLKIRTDKASGAILITAWDSVTSAEGARVADVRVAQSDQAMQKVAEDDFKKDARAFPSGTPVGDDDSSSSKAIPEILVKGARSMNADIARNEDGPLPYVVFGAQEIERSTEKNIEDFLKTRLPMNQVQFTASMTAGNNSGNRSAVNLRGLGTKQTLLLVNGRRLPGVRDTHDLSQPDINGIPMAAIERIEVLPSTASGIYGGGATGGVVNIILKRDYSGVELRMTYDNAFDTDAAGRTLDATTGFTIGSRTKVLVSGSYADQNDLLVYDRDYAADGRALQVKNNPAEITSGGVVPRGYTTNISSADGSNLVLDSGTPLNSPITFIPVGYAGVAGDGGQALVANAGRYNLDIPNDIQGGQNSLRNSPTVQSLTANVQHEINDWLEAFLDASILENNGVSWSANVTNTAQLAANAINNPFTRAIRVSFPVTNLRFPVFSDSQTMRATAGVTVRLPRQWSLQLEHGHSRARNEVFTLTASAAPLMSTVNAAYASGVLDVMRDLNAYPLDYGPYLSGSSHRFGPSDTTLRDTTLRAAGTVFRLPGGNVTLSTMIERRKEVAEKMFVDLVLPQFSLNRITYSPSRFQIIDSYYLETSVPLLPARGRWGLRNLELQLSGRRDEYLTASPAPSIHIVPSRGGPLPELSMSRNKVNSSDYTLGLRYSPVEDVMLRLSLGSGFLPPALSEITPEFSSNLIVLADPKREDVNIYQGPISFAAGGDDKLRPERSRSLSAGAVFSPRAIPGLRLSIDYTSIQKVDEIVSPDILTLLSLEDLVPGRITRGPKLDTDPADWAGPITGIDQRLINVARTRVEAYDVQLNYDLQTSVAGIFRFYALASVQTRFAQQTFITTPLTDKVGFNNGPAKLRGNGGVSWDKDALTLGWSFRHLASNRVCNTTQSAASCAASGLDQGLSAYPSQTYHDAYAVYRFDSAPFGRTAVSGMRVMVGIDNVFDKVQIRATTGETGGYAPFADPRGRTYTVSLTSSF